MVKKIVASIAVVGTVAAVALFNLSGSASDNSSNGTFLAVDNTDQQVVSQFNDFISKHQKNYLTKEEYKARLTIFQSSLEFINKSNNENKDFKLAANSFADMSASEYKQRLGLKKNPQFEDEDDQ
jgi:cell shape-determining protein MreC